METRTVIAYLLIALLFAALVGGIAYARHNTRDRKIARQRERESGRRTEW